MALNGIRDRNLIHPGDELNVGVGATESVGSAPSVEAQEAPALAVDIATVSEEAAELTENILATDPSDYGVASDNTIEILTDETLGHFADWLGLTSNDLRRLNNLRSSATVRIGDRVKLDFSKATRADFEARRKQYHSGMQAQYFASYRIRNTENHSLLRGELVSDLARARAVPMWLFRQYNPGLGDGSQVRAGQVVVFPVVERVGD
jgi:membrane-bound lytic murein transglycosylase D